MVAVSVLVAKGRGKKGCGGRGNKLGANNERRGWKRGLRAGIDAVDDETSFLTTTAIQASVHSLQPRISSLLEHRLHIFTTDR